jgi:chromosome segregation ATPase
MTDTTDVLDKWADEIAFAESADFPAEPDHRTTVGDAKYMAIRDLAAALQTLRTERDEDDARYMKALKRIANADDEIERLRARVAELEAKIRDLQVIHNDAYERSRPTELEELRAERDVLKERVAELESHLAATDPWREASKR